MPLYLALISNKHLCFFCETFDSQPLNRLLEPWLDNGTCKKKQKTMDATQRNNNLFVGWHSHPQFAHGSLPARSGCWRSTIVRPCSTSDVWAPNNDGMICIFFNIPIEITCAYTCVCVILFAKSPINEDPAISRLFSQSP